MAIPKETLLKIYRDMVRCRTFDAKALELLNDGVLIGGWHGATGEEGLCGVYSQLRQSDYCGYTHRIYYPWLTKGISTGRLFAEQLGRATGTAKGKGVSHISEPALGIFGRSGMQGGHFPLLVGATIASRLRGGDEVAVITAGEGACTSGMLHEAANHAAVWKLPVIFLCHNNQYMQTLPLNKMWAQPDVSRIAQAYAMPAWIVDGGDPIAVAEAAQVAIEQARAGEGPGFLEVKTLRWGVHTSMEPDGLAYRDFEEIKYSKANRDPIANLADTLIDWGILTAPSCEQILVEAIAEMDEAARFAMDSPVPDVADAFSDLYVDTSS